MYKCGGHVGRAHYNKLKEVSKKKVFSADIKRKYKEKVLCASVKSTKLDVGVSGTTS